MGVFRVNPLIMTLAMAAILLGLFTWWAQTVPHRVDLGRAVHRERWAAGRSSATGSRGTSLGLGGRWRSLVIWDAATGLGRHDLRRR